MENYKFFKKPYFLFLAFLAGFSTLAATKIQIAVTKTTHLSELSFLVITLLALIIFFLLLHLFDNYLWRIKIFQILKISPFPYLGGRWVGFLTSSYKVNGQNTIVPITLEISQTSSNISITAYFKKGKSNSFIANFKTIKNKPHLCYVYNNTQAKTEPSHDRGTVILKPRLKDGKRILKGSYFNDLQPQSNHGEIKVSYSGSKLLNQV